MSNHAKMSSLGSAAIQQHCAAFRQDPCLCGKDAQCSMFLNSRLDFHNPQSRRKSIERHLCTQQSSSDLHRDASRSINFDQDHVVAQSGDDALLDSQLSFILYLLGFIFFVEAHLFQSLHKDWIQDHHPSSYSLEPSFNFLFNEFGAYILKSFCNFSNS